MTTPHLLVDPTKVEANTTRLHDHLTALGSTLRLHVKTAKSVDVAKIVFRGGTGPITVSTLHEAEEFAAHGFTDVVYAVGIAPDKLDRVRALRAKGVDLVVLLDNVDQARAAASAGVPALIEVDCDGHRGGVLADDPALLAIAGALGDGVRGVLTHAGESYYCRTEEALVEAAEHERATAVRAAETLRAAGFPAPVVSIGSTPTAHFARDLTGVTEVRAGNYVFFDLVMAGIGVCTLDDLALSVVTTVIGHREDKGWILTDAGWMATSRDRGTADQPVDQGYGLVCDRDGHLIPGLLMTGASQEHGVLSMRQGPLPHLPVGTKLRVLPNHACATAAQHDRYHLTTGDTAWPRLNGW
ncbi:alanine racemase [Umezawaea endophytica]|uniref:Alanine racemase n=1 Tax=Umezawaea endophytica TaxID=1654476 RepID=A0A9X2VJS1_9PSEU|nr:alanine racemase [Umezawaea endophytica]MCS7477367.1 alanine racemase [Umezawaea endophytica]